MKIDARQQAIGCAIAGTLAAGCGPQPAEEPAMESSTIEHQAVGHGQAEPAHAEWSYEEATGPATWAGLSPDYALCGSGTEQSPIDISIPEAADNAPLVTQYKPASARIIRHEHVVDIIDNGHTIQVNYDEGSVLSVGGIDFELAQYHFHAPSEHTIEGRHAPMEMHLVHASADGELAVLGVLIEEGEHNAGFAPLWANLPDEPGVERHYENIMINIDDLLPEDHRLYRYMGSLTTPPCSEGVRWFVAVQPIELSGEQIATFTAIINDNNRPVQLVGQRTVQVDTVIEEGTP